jgi:hypothetical protein
MTRTAQCACGATAITVSGEPQQYNVCHCSNCKRRTGSAFGISTYFLRSDVQERKGRTATYAFHHSVWNHDQERHFCEKCGTTLFWYLSSRPTLIGIAGGCFEDGSLGEPTWSANEQQRCSWVTLPAHCRAK